jgi:hypothetical protein
MSRNSKLKRAVRSRMLQTGENYTTAHRMLRQSEDACRERIEPHYWFGNWSVIEYVDGEIRKPLPLPEDPMGEFTWGYTGSGPNTSARAVLLDATGSEDHALAMRFVSDNLQWSRGPFALTIAEVRAWRTEVEPGE